MSTNRNSKEKGIVKNRAKIIQTIVKRNSLPVQRHKDARAREEARKKKAGARLRLRAPTA